MTPDVFKRSLDEIAQSVAAGETTASALLDVVEREQARWEGGEIPLHAFLSFGGDNARAAAQTVDASTPTPKARGPKPLLGVPVAIKDNLCTLDYPTTCGSRILEGYVSPYSATAVERLEAAGAVLVGHTNMDEFGMGSSCEASAYGPTRNPWDLARVPGGSSGGSAAAVAARLVPLALGSDTGGSVRQPAALCGVAGLKPTYGRVSRYGLVAFASSLDQIGPLAGSVGDVALALEIIAGQDPLDATSSAVPSGDYAASARQGGGLDGVRAGVPRQLAVDRLEPDVRGDWERSLARLEELGVRLVEVDVPALEAATAVYYVLANSEASANLARFDGVRYGRRSRDASTLTELYHRSRSEGFGAEVKRRILLGTFALSSGYHEAYYDRAAAVARALGRELAAALEGTDVLLSPASPSAAFRLGERSDPLTMYLSDVYTVPANLAGLPAVAVPSGVSAEGLPLSLQLVGRAFDEARLLRVAAAFEAAADFRRPMLPVAPTQAPPEAPV